LTSTNSVGCSDAGNDAGDRIAASGSFVPVSTDRSAPGQDQPLVDVPGDVPPRLFAAEAANFDQRIFVLVGFDPDPREARAHEFGQTLGERHE
jgi:hypothetical protein